MWECLHCRERVEDVFEVCWRCQAKRDGTPSDLNDPPREEGEEEEIASLHKKYAPRDCLRCRSEMNYAGGRDLHEGGPEALLLRYLSLDMYVCPECLHVEFVTS